MKKERLASFKQRLLEKVDSESRLARPGHTDDDGVRRQVLSVVKNRLRFLRSVRPGESPQIEKPEFFEVPHAISERILELGTVPFFYQSGIRGAL